MFPNVLRQIPVDVQSNYRAAGFPKILLQPRGYTKYGKGCGYKQRLAAYSSDKYSRYSNDFCDFML